MYKIISNWLKLHQWGGQLLFIMKLESFCERSNGHLGPIKCWETAEWRTTCGLSGGTQLRGVSKI
jgi:hypothetical protein